MSLLNPITPASIGAVNKGEFFVSVKDAPYGALGDGTTDDSTAIRAAITDASAAGGGVVTIPKGTYRLAAALDNVGSNVTIQGIGNPVLVHDWVGVSGTGTFGNANRLTTGDTNIVIRDLEIKTITSTQLGKHLEFREVKGLKISNIRLRGCYGGWNSAFVNCDDVWIDRPDWDSGRGLGNYGDGIHIMGGSGYVISNGIIYSGDDCISMTLENVICRSITDVVVNNMKLYSDYASLLKISSTGAFATGATISRISYNNITGVQNPNNGVGVWLNGASATLQDISLSNVKIDCSTGTNKGMIASTINGLQLDTVEIVNPNNYGLWLDTCTNVQARGFNVRGNRSTTVPNFRIDTCTNVRFIGGGSIGGVNLYGAHQGAGGACVDISYNGFLIDGGCTSSGIRIQNTTGTRVRNSRIKNAGAPIHEVVATGDTFTVVRDNDFRGNSAASVYTSAAGIVFDNNIGDGLVGGGGSVYRGTGSPETVVAAAVGSAYLRSDGATGTTMYVKETGTGNTGWRAMAAAGTAIPPDIQVFTPGSGTWTKPASAVSVNGILICGGGGGGSGRRGATSTVRCGGGGGSGAAVSRFMLSASAVAATVTVTVGAGGAGGIAQTVDSTDGNPGASGGASSFGGYCRAAPGTGGGGGTVSTGVAGTVGGGSQPGTAGVAASTTGTGGGSAGFSSGGSAGPSGGGITSANVASNGGNGTGATSVLSFTYAGGVVDTTAPVVATAATAGTATPGGSSGGGASSITTAAQAGGAGGTYGGGGAGGGASLNGFASGAGGAGGDGIVVIVTYF